jgi:hypothetical protein
LDAAALGQPPALGTLLKLKASAGVHNSTRVVVIVMVKLCLSHGVVDYLGLLEALGLGKGVLSV